MSKFIKLSVTLLAISALVIGGYYKNKKYPVYGFHIVNVYPHDATSWCQGLEVVDGYFYEGTGRKKGLAKLKKVDIKSGEVLDYISLDEKYFGEGVTVWSNKIYQLTYKAGEAFVYEKDTFKLIDKFEYPTEGWGLTNDGEYLIMSDGTATIRFLDPETFEVVRSVKVRNNKFSVKNLNELEYVDGEIYANILFSDYIVRITATTGEINAWINLTGILPDEDKEKYEADVMNCIAVNPDNGNLYVTGKLWPKLFEIKLAE